MLSCLLAFTPNAMGQCDASLNVPEYAINLTPGNPMVTGAYALGDECCTNQQGNNSCLIFNIDVTGFDGLAFCFDPPCSTKGYVLPANTSACSASNQLNAGTALDLCKEEVCIPNGATMIELLVCKPGAANNLLEISILGIPSLTLEVEDIVEGCNDVFAVNGTQIPQCGNGASDVNFATPTITWSSIDDPNLDYLDISDPENAVFDYDGPTVTDCNGINFDYTVTTDASSLSDCITQNPSVTKTATVFPALNGQIVANCNLGAGTVELCFEFDSGVICPQVTYSWMPGGATSRCITVNADDTQYTVDVSRNDVPLAPGCIPFIASAPASCCTQDADCLTDLDVIREGCASDIPPAFINPTDVFSDIESCGAIVTMDFTVLPGGDTDFCTDGDGVDFTRRYTIYFDGVAFAICDQTIFIEDTTDPDLTGCTNRDATAECGQDDIVAWHTANLAALAACATDACDDDLTISSDFANAPFVVDCGTTGTTTVTYTVTDDCDNATDFVATYTVEDTTDPDLTGCTNRDATAECGQDDIVAWHTANLAALATCATDACDDDLTISSDFANAPFVVDCGTTGTTTVTYTVTDDCDNATDFVATYTVEDTTDPDLTGCTNRDATAECGQDDIVAWHTANLAALATCATDACDDDLTISSDFANAPFVVDCGTTGTTTVTYTVTDDCDNATDFVATYTVEDTTDPDLTGCTNRDATAECGQDDITAWHTANLAALAACATDACDDDLTISSDFANAPFVVDCGTTGTTTVTYTVTDDCDNATDFVATYTVEDTTDPDLTGCTNRDATAECGQDDIVAWHTANLAALAACATDACDDDLTISSDFANAPFVVDCGTTGTTTVTYTVTDDCDNATDFVATYTVEDTTDPDLTGCTNRDATAECGQDDITAWHTANLAALAACATDACDDDLTISSDFANAPFVVDCGTTGTTTVTYTVTDDCDNATDFVATYTVEDTTDPDLTGCTNRDATAECGQDDIVAWHTANLVALTACATDACDDDLTISSDFANAPFVVDCGTTGTTTVTYTVTDDCDNATDFVATYTVEDTTDPDLTGCTNRDATAECGQDDIAAWHTANLAALAACATDACDDDLTISSDFANAPFVVDCGTTGTTTVTYTVTDDCDNATDFVATYSVEDTTDPDLNGCTNRDATAECGQDDITAWHTANLAALAACATDACDDDLTISSDFANAPFVVDCGTTGTTTVTYTVTDDCDNATDFVATYTVEDTTDPDLTGCTNRDATAECGQDDIAAWHTANLAALAACATDACDDDLTISSDFANAPFVVDCGTTGTTTVTYTITDDCDNATDFVATYTVEDTTDPDLTGCTNRDATAECGQDDITAWHTANLAALAACATDACDDDLTISSDFANAPFVVDCGTTGTTTVTYTVTDDCDNATDFVATYTVEDTTDPTISCPAEVTVECGMPTDVNSTGNATGSDICGGVTITHSDSFVPACGNTGTITRTFTATDDCNNTSTCTQIITIVDTTDPIIAGPMPDGATMNVECNLRDPNWTPFQVTTGDLTITDNCSDRENITITYVDILEEEGECGVSDFLSLWRCVWTATDECGNSSTYTLFLRIVDTQGPIFTSFPDDMSIECSDPLFASMATAVDNCSEVEITFEDSRIDGDCDNRYTIRRRFTAIDGCGNPTTQDQFIMVTDDSAPVLYFEDEYVNQYTDGQDVFTDCSEFGTIINLSYAVGARDLCSGVSQVDFDYEDFGLFDCAEFGYSGYVRTTWSSTDDCGNASSISLNWYLVDQTPPMLQGVPEDDCVTALPAVPNVQAVDDCEFATLAYTQSDPVDCDGGQYVERTWTATDVCGNTTSATQRLTITNGSGLGPDVNIDLPGLSGLPSGSTAQLAAECDEDGTWIIPDFAAALVTSTGCGGIEVRTDLQLLNSGSCSTTGYLARYQLTVSAADLCNNTTEYVLFVELIDTTPPVVEGPAELVLSCGEAIPEIAASDACNAIASISFMDIQPIIASCPDSPQAFERIWLITDACDNTTVFAQSITIIDDEGPVFSNVPEDACNDTTISGPVTAFDECSGTNVNVVFNEVTSNEPGCGQVLTRTWTAMDACGNTTTATQQVFFTDDSAPVLEFSHPLLIGLEDGGELVLPVDFTYGNPQEIYDFGGDAIAIEDNCASNLLAVLSVTDITEEGDCESNGYLARLRLTWTVTDPCGNSSKISVILIYVDTYGPEIFYVPEDITLFCEDDLPPVAVVYLKDNYDQDIDLLFEEIEVVTDFGLRIIRRWTANDDCGNVTIEEQLIDIVGNTLVCEFELPETVLCNSSGNQITVIASGGTPPYTYSWEMTDCDGFLTSAPTNATVFYTVGFTTQNFSVTITDARGCERVCTTSVVCEKEESEGGLPQLQAFPNPANGMLTVKNNDLVEQVVRLSLYSTTGQVILRQMIDYWPQEGYRINTATIPSGIYIIRLDSAGYDPMLIEVVIQH
ncbi:T9SS type A sorting domain-containing protein [Lewinella sp. LCG006]|uniref:T9SS type A sorting domain-containing protein n=1 Tax=Lewinella sp. LCG006 TaxID=3231911 RepID=UPI003460E7B2